jgi:site-specific recombinase XerD
MKNSPGCSGSGQRTPKRPLVPYLAAFERLLRRNGYAPTTARCKVRLARDFSAWLSRRTINIKDLNLEQGEQYLRYRARHRRPSTGDIASLKQLLELLRRKGIVAQQKVCKQRTPLDRLLDRYALYLREERAVARDTVINYSRVARGLLAQRFSGSSPN